MSTPIQLTARRFSHTASNRSALIVGSARRSNRYGWLAMSAALLYQFLAVSPAHAQVADYRQSRTYVGVGLGVYTFHGPVDLWKPRSEANFVRKKDPAFLGNITFPVTENRLYMRGQIGYTSSDRQYGTRILISGENEFIVNDLIWFETELILNLRPPKRRIVPYLFGGVGLLLADPFGRTNAHRESIPSEHVKRTQAYFPIGVGVDLALTPRVSLYLESGMRLSRNSVFLDRAEPDPFNSTILLAGIRFALGRRLLPPPPAIPPLLMCPMCPRPPEPICCACQLLDLQPITFENNSAAITEKARQSLKENVQALALAENSDCKLMVSGYYHKESEDDGLGHRRAMIVIKYYEDHGVSEFRFTPPKSEGVSCEKNKYEIGCPPNQRVEIEPFCADGPICPNPVPPKPFSPLQGN